MNIWCEILMGVILTAGAMFAFLWGYCMGSMLKDITDWLESWWNKW